MIAPAFKPAREPTTTESPSAMSPERSLDALRVFKSQNYGHDFDGAGRR